MNGFFLAFAPQVRYDIPKGGGGIRELRIKQRVFSWSDTYDVYDESGEPRYYVEAELFAFGHQIHVYDKRSGQEVGTITKEFSFLVPRYHVDFRGWEVSGDFMGWDYEATCRGATVLSVSKELFHWGDTYVLRYQNVADEIPGLLLTIAIDAVNCSKN